MSMKCASFANNSFARYMQSAEVRLFSVFSAGFYTKHIALEMRTDRLQIYAYLEVRMWLSFWCVMRHQGLYFKEGVSVSQTGLLGLMSLLGCSLTFTAGRAIAQAVSRWLPNAAARARSRVWSSGICSGQSGAGAGFLRVLRVPPAIFIPPIAPQSPSPIIWGWYNRPEVAGVQGT
jgi:hypothetical protein